jgi:hypothetical protein
MGIFITIFCGVLGALLLLIAYVYFIFLVPVKKIRKLCLNNPKIGSKPNNSMFGFLVGNNPDIDKYSKIDFL